MIALDFMFHNLFLQTNNDLYIISQLLICEAPVMDMHSDHTGMISFCCLAFFS